MPDEHLPVRVGAGADPDRRHVECLRDPRCDRGGNRLEHDGERACLLQRERVVVQALRGGRGPALSLEAAELRRRLRGQTDVAHHSDVRLGDGTHPRDHAPCALELDDVGAALLDEPDRARDRLLVRDLVRAERKVADDERAPRRPRHRAGQEDHLVERHRHGRLVAEHHHRGRVADEDQLDARLIGE